MTIRLVLALILLIIAVPLILIGRRHIDSEDADIPFRGIGLALFAAGSLLFLLACIRVVSPGQVGIPVAFGKANAPLASGVHLVNPFASIEKMSVRTETYTMSIAQGEGNKQGDDSVSVLGSDGAQGSVDATVLFHLQREAASTVYRELGTGYVEKIVRPTVRTCIRDGFATTQMVEAATTARATVASLINDCVTETLEPHGLILEKFQLRDIHLSKGVQNSVDAKVTAQQAAEQQEFELAKSQQQAEIARVEAQGRADAQQIIACGGTVHVADDGTTTVVPNTGAKCQNTLSPAYLQYLYIQSLEKISESDTNSTVILPFDQDLTPLLNLGGQK